MLPSPGGNVVLSDLNYAYVVTVSSYDILLVVKTFTLWSPLSSPLSLVPLKTTHPCAGIGIGIGIFPVPVGVPVDRSKQLSLSRVVPSLALDVVILVPSAGGL